LELPAATPHSDLKTLAVASIKTRTGFGNAGDKQSRIMAASLNMSAYAREQERLVMLQKGIRSANMEGSHVKEVSEHMHTNSR